MKTPRHRVHQGPRTLEAEPDVVVVGAGPAGLSAATELRRRDVESVLVIERDAQAGGVPRLCDHTGFGLQDLHRSLSGPRYASRLVDESLRAGIELWLSTTVTDVSSEGVVSVSGPAGIAVLHPRSVVLATGVRERPRSARLVPGDRPAGVLTTGQLQQLVAARQPLVGSRALVVGAEHVSYSAALTLRHAGIAVVAMTTELEAHQSVALGAWAMRSVLRTPLWTSTRVASLTGHGRLVAAEVQDLTTGARRSVAVDMIVFTGDWIPDHELARRAEVPIDPATLGPLSDAWGVTPLETVRAAGNLVHPGETAGTAALSGRRLGHMLGSNLGGVSPPRKGPPVRVVAEAPLAWVWPSLVDPEVPPRTMMLWTSTFLERPVLVVEQEGREIARVRLPHGTPNRSIRLKVPWIAAVERRRGPVMLRVADDLSASPGA